MISRYTPLLDRFNLQHEPVTECGCWLWTGTLHGSGYGSIFMHGKNVRAHRAAYMLFVGRIPEGKHVLHRCDNPSCVNPNHLFLGSHLDNMKDKTKKGRAVSLKGIKNPRAKLSEADVREIRARKGTSQVDMAKEFGVSQAKICSVINFTSWKHVN